ncbi:MAG: hypothetical protein ABIH52_01485 [Candidatus Aenigmatarchaeota archaeon]|nr:hypothetical protein [Nanoarchaeota archaeon]
MGKKLDRYENYPVIILLIIGVAIVFSISTGSSEVQLSGNCVDSDGKDFFTSGNMRLGFDTYEDSCKNFVTAIDYYCYGTTLYATETCPYTCLDGRCLTLEQAETYCGNGVTEHFEECDYMNQDDAAAKICGSNCRFSS